MNKLSKFVLSAMIGVAGVLFVPSVVKAEDVPIDEAHFPDAKFREYVSTEIDKDGNGTLSTAEIDDVTLMEINDMGISELKGI